MLYVGLGRNLFLTISEQDYFCRRHFGPDYFFTTESYKYRGYRDNFMLKNCFRDDFMLNSGFHKAFATVNSGSRDNCTLQEE